MTNSKERLRKHLARAQEAIEQASVLDENRGQGDAQEARRKAGRIACGA